MRAYALAKVSKKGYKCRFLITRSGTLSIFLEDEMEIMKIHLEDTKKNKGFEMAEIIPIEITVDGDDIDLYRLAK
jgi:hypothetical protein